MLSSGTISRITDAVAEAVLEWQRRPLEEFYPVVYLDAIRVKVRVDHRVASRSAHIAVGVDMDGIKHVLGIWVQAEEGASFWAHVCAELANRGVKDVLIVCCDGLTGLPEAIEATWPQATVQTCVVHLIRASMRFVSYGDRRKVAAALKADLHRPEPGGCLAGSDRLLRVRYGGQVPPDGDDLGAGLGAVHSLPGLPADAQAGHLHHQQHRVAELPAAQGLQEPRSLPLR